MKKDKALEIANDFIRKMNHNGEIDTRIATYPLENELELDIQYQLEEDGMRTVCSVMDKDSGETLDICSCSGTDNPQDIADCVMHLIPSNE